jgi:hypothetical protein
MSDELLEQMKRDAGEGPSDDKIAGISRLAQEYLKAEGDVDRLEKQLKAAKSRFDNIRDKLLPEAMDNAQTKGFTLNDGRKLSLGEEMSCSVPKERKGEIMAKLRDDGEGDLISNVLTVEIDKGKDNMAGVLEDEAKKLGFEPKRDESVNTGTLKARLKQRVEAGDEVDLPFYGAFLVRRAKIKQ